MNKLKSSIKSLQEVINNIQNIGPTCINEIRTLSFRNQAIHHQNDAIIIDDDDDDDDEYDYDQYYNSLSSHNCHYMMINSPNSSSSSLFALSKPYNGASETCQHDSPSTMNPLGGEEEEDFICSETATTATMSSSSTTHEHLQNCEVFIDRLPSTDSISSERFFYTPRTTKSIMEEKSKFHGGKSCICSFCEDSLRIEMNSNDPFNDFRSSMAEMIDARKLKDWQALQQLLHCYLSLNEKKNHKVIVLAFVDLLMQLISQDKELCIKSSA